MRTRRCAALFVLVAALSFTAALRAEEGAARVAIPVVVIDAGKAVDTTTVDQVVEKLVAPTVRGDAIRERLGLIRPVDGKFVATVKNEFEKALDLFYEGKEEQAEPGFLKIVGWARKLPATYSSSPVLRELDFKTRLFLAMIARAFRDDERIEREIRYAAARYPDFTPSSEEFPPWLCGFFDTIRMGVHPRTGAIRFNGPPACHLFASSRDLGSGGIYNGVPLGVHAVMASCNGRLGPPQSLRVGEGTTSYDPVVLAATTVASQDGDMVLAADPGAEDISLEGDALGIARVGGWPRILVLVGKPDRLEIRLLDLAIGSAVREATAPHGDNPGIDVAAAGLTQENWKKAAFERKREERPWYRDGAAWTLVGIGVAALGAGIALDQVYGSPSSLEAVSWSLIVAGAGATGTGVVLFFVPPGAGSARREEAGEQLTVGLAAGVTF